MRRVVVSVLALQLIAGMHHLHDPEHERRSFMRARRFLAGTVVLGGVLLGLPATAVAQTLVPCNGAALQSAVAAANTAGGGTLNLSPGCTYSLTTPDSGENGLAVITTPIRVNGNRATITRSSATIFRFFNVAGPGNLTLNALTLRDGRASNGGAILVGAGGRLTLSASTVTGNTATSVGGGGIINLGGTVVIDSSTLSNNTGSQGGSLNNQGAGTTTFTSSAVTGNHAISGFATGAGGGIAIVNGSVTLSGTRLAGNDATGPGAFGGAAVSTGTLTLTGSPVLNNIANGANASGGGLWNSATLNVANSQVLGNTATGTNARGGGIFNSAGTTTLQSVAVVTNQAVGTGADGGGIFRPNGTVTVTGSSVAANRPNNCGNPSTVPGCA
jgi:hypothetical protein